MSKDATMLLITCSCGQRMKVPAQAMGKTATCVKCGERVKISAETADPLSEAAQGASTPSGAPPIKVPLAEAKVEPGIAALLQQGLITEGNLAEAVVVQRDFPRNLWELLVDLGHVSSDDFHRSMAKAKLAASIDLGNYDIPDDMVQLIPESIVKQSLVIPVDQLGKLLTLAVACPHDKAAIAEIESITGLRVKPMLCRLEDIRKVIQSHFPDQVLAPELDGDLSAVLRREFGEKLQTNAMAKRVFAIDALPPLEQTSTHFGPDSDSASLNLRDLADLYASDPSATALLLRMSNSSAFGFERRVDNIGLALALLGREGAMFTLQTATNQTDISLLHEFDLHRFWKESLLRAESAQVIASSLNLVDEFAAYTTALVSNIGRLALATSAPNSYPLLTKNLIQPQLSAVENKLYSFTSAEAGQLLALKWNFPPVIAEAIRYQETPDAAPNAKALSSVVALAAFLAASHVGAAKPQWETIDGLLASMNLTRRQLVDLFRETTAEAAAS